MSAQQMRERLADREREPLPDLTHSDSLKAAARDRAPRLRMEAESLLAEFRGRLGEREHGYLFEKLKRTTGPGAVARCCNLIIGTCIRIERGEGATGHR